MFDTAEEKAAKAEAKAKAEIEAKEKAKVEAEATAKAKAEVEQLRVEEEAKVKAAEAEAAKLKVENLDADNLEGLIEEAKALGIKLPKVSLAGLKSKKPEDIEKEKTRLAKGRIEWLKTMIAKKKAEAKMKPIDKRRAVLAARFRAVKSRNRAHTYTNKNIEAWLEEYNLINSNPKSWNKITSNGTKSYTPGNKRKKSAKDILDGMDLED